MLNKASIILFIMLNFFFLKEVSSFCNINFDGICLIDDLNEESEDNDETSVDTESDFKCQTSNPLLFNFSSIAVINNSFSPVSLSHIQDPEFEIPCPPPKI